MSESVCLPRTKLTAATGAIFVRGLFCRFLNLLVRKRHKRNFPASHAPYEANSHNRRNLRTGFSPHEASNLNWHDLHTGFTLIELVIVVIILAILASMAVPGFIKSKEQALANSAIVCLRLIRAAELAYLSETTTFYPAGGSEGDIAVINTNLRLDLNENDWDYTVTGGAGFFQADAVRIDGPFTGCTYFIDETAADPADNGLCP